MTDDPSTPIGPEELVQELRRLRDRIPMYEQLTVRKIRSMTRVANLNVEFVDAGLSAAGAYDEAASIVGATAEELRGQVDASGRWSVVESELYAMLRGVSAANLKRRYSVGRAILQIYGVLRNLIRMKEHQDLIPFVEEMKRTNEIRGKKKPSAAGEERK